MISLRMRIRFIRFFTFANVGIFVGAILAGFSLVSLVDGFQTHQIRRFNTEPVNISVVRIADAFELYNNKRFPK